MNFYSRFIVFISFSILSNFSSATNYYISTTGSDVASGLIGFPKATLASVFVTYDLAAGDTIFVGAGTYTETGITDFTSIGSYDFFRQNGAQFYQSLTGLDPGTSREALEDMAGIQHGPVPIDLKYNTVIYLPYAAGIAELKSKPASIKWQ